MRDIERLNFVFIVFGSTLSSLFSVVLAVSASCLTFLLDCSCSYNIQSQQLSIAPIIAQCIPYSWSVIISLRAVLLRLNLKLQRNSYQKGPRGTEPFERVL